MVAAMKGEGNFGVEGEEGKITLRKWLEKLRNLEEGVNLISC